MAEATEQDKSPPPSPNAAATATTTATTTTTTNNNNNNNPAQATKPQQDPLHYMHRPPRIVPNYGKKARSSGITCVPKSSVSRVLLYDNVTQQQMLDVKISHLGAEQRKTGRLMDMHRKSFVVRRALKRQKHATDTAPLHAFPPLLVTKPPPPPPPPPATSTEEDETAADPYNDRQHGQNEAVDQTTRAGDLATVDNVRLPHLAVDRAGATTSTGFSHRAPATENTGGPKRSATHAVLVNHRSRGPARGPSLLPGIHRGSGDSGPAAVSVSEDAGKVVLSLETDHHGMTRMMHTFHHSHGRAGKRGGKKGGGERGSGGGGVRVGMVEDERYRRLERVLVKVQPPNDGYLELSPSFHLPRQGVTFTRPSSFLSRSSSSSPRRRRPSSSSSSSLAPGPVVVGLL